MVKKPVRDEIKYKNYCKAIELLKIFLQQNNRGQMTVVDNTDTAFDFHSIVVELKNDEFDAMEIKKFTEVLNLFDGMSIIGSSKGDISFSLLMENIYVKGE